MFTMQGMISGKSILLGNSFPLSLIRREVVIRPMERDELVALCQGRRIVSFWGHANTVSAASQWLGRDVSPKGVRPVLTLSAEFLPMLDGEVFRDCHVLSPDYVADFRPAVGEEVPLEKIHDWNVLHIQWISVYKES